MNDVKKSQMTQEGLDKVIAELDELKNVRRPEIIQALKDARAQGDLSENSEYDAARTNQAETEAKIKELEFLVENTEVVKTIKKDKVNVGVNVKIEYCDDKEVETYSIVGSKESDPFSNKISDESPIAKAILGGKVGETKSVTSPNGSYDVKIVEIF